MCDQKAVTRTNVAGAPAARTGDTPGAPAARAEEPRNFNFNFGLTADWPVVIVAVAVGIAGAAKLYTEAFGSERRKQDRADARAQRRGELWDGANATARGYVILGRHDSWTASPPLTMDINGAPHAVVQEEHDYMVRGLALARLCPTGSLDVVVTCMDGSKVECTIRVQQVH